jgi:hypothetical protein
MAATKQNTSKRRNKLYLLVALTIAIPLVLTGYFTWHRLPQPKMQSHPAKVVLESESTKKCLEEFDKKHPLPPGLSDHRDKSECYPDIVSRSSLSETEKQAAQQNSQLQSDATRNRDLNTCDKIKGTYYNAYPPNLSKAVKVSEDEARAMCKSIVQNWIEQDEERKKKDLER